jgi:hypothetical protein
MLSSGMCRRVDRGPTFRRDVSSPFQSRKISERRTSVSRWLQTKPIFKITQLCKNRMGGRAGRFRLIAQSAATCSLSFLARGFFYPKYGGDMFS